TTTVCSFFFYDPPTPEIYTLSLHDALPIFGAVTHVFINDPLQGYGVLAEWMVYEAGLAAAGAAGDRTGERAAAAGFQPFSDELSGGGVSCWQGAFASSSPTTT